MQTLLITGGAGFIGSNFIRYIYDKYPNYRITVLDALTYAGSVHNLPEGSFDSDRFEFWYGNVRNAEMVDTLVSKSDKVIHFAAESHVTRSIYDNLLFFETDIIGTQIIANAVLKYRDNIERFIHISTSEVYGTATCEKMDENHPLNPLSPYASAKCGADRLVYSYWTTYKIPAVIVRPFNNYGQNQHLEKVIPRFITSCILGEPLTVHGDGSAARDFIHVNDHCRALDKILHADDDVVNGEVFNIGSDEHISVLEIANKIKALMSDSNSEIKSIGNRPGQVFRHTCDSSKTRKQFDWRPEISFDDGLKQVIEWYKNNESWWSQQMWMRHIPIVTSSGKRELH